MSQPDPSGPESGGQELNSAESKAGLQKTSLWTTAMGDLQPRPAGGDPLRLFSWAAS